MKVGSTYPIGIGKVYWVWVWVWVWVWYGKVYWYGYRSDIDG